MQSDVLGKDIKIIVSFGKIELYDKKSIIEKVLMIRVP